MKLTGTYLVQDLYRFNQNLTKTDTTETKETWNDLHIRPPEGQLYKEIKKGNDKKSIAILYYEKEAKWNNQRGNRALC